MHSRNVVPKGSVFRIKDESNLFTLGINLCKKKEDKTITAASFGIKYRSFNKLRLDVCEIIQHITGIKNQVIATVNNGKLLVVTRFNLVFDNIRARNTGMIITINIKESQ